MCHSVSACIKRAPSLGVALLVGVTIVSCTAIVHAQQTISTAVTGPVLGGNNSIAITATGSVTSSAPSGIALRTVTGNTITTLTNSGAISASRASGNVGGYGLSNDSSTIGSITNSGSWDGEWAALYNADTATVTSFTNQAGGRLRGILDENPVAAIDNRGTFTSLINSGTLTAVTAIANSGTISSLTNQAGGMIGLGQFGIGVTSGGVITSLTNSGTISASIALENGGTITSLVNNGHILGNDRTIDVVGGILGTLTNSGTIQGTLDGIRYQGTLVSGTLTNAATGMIMAGSYEAVQINSHLQLLQNAGHIVGGTSPNYSAVAVVGTLDTLDNTGLIYGSSRGVSVGGSESGSPSIGTFTNKSGGSISGSDYGVHVLAGSTITSLDNRSGGTITTDFGLGTALFNGGTITTLTNAGSMTGVRGIENTGLIGSIVNTGAIASLHNSGTIGGGIGTTAISSTGAGALIGTLYNNNAISGDVLIAGQSFEVYSSLSGASFKNGTITVSDGSLNLQYGKTMLDSDVVVHSALNNYAILSLEKARSVDGAFVQGVSATLTTSFQTPSDYGRLNISGNATLAGLLNIDDPNSALTFGTYTLLTFANRSGTFSSLSYMDTALTSVGTNLWTDGTWLFRENYYTDSMSLTVSAVPEPSTIALGALGIAGARLLKARANRRKIARRR